MYKTFDQHFGANLKAPFLLNFAANFLLNFAANFLLFLLFKAFQREKH